MAKKDNEKSPERLQMEKDTPYPYYVFFILGNEFCERYAFYGMHAILVIFLKQFLGFDDDLSTILYHSFIALCYFFPLIGGIIADSFWGKVKTILVLSIVYSLGMALMAVAAIPSITEKEDKTDPGVVNQALTFIALFTIAIGTGGIKPCVASLGGDQFSMNEVGREQFAGFFSLFYASINAGSLISTFVSPVLRDKVKCFERDDCFFIAFLVPSVLMLVSIGAFVLGRKNYIVHKPTGNIFLQFTKATWAGIWGKWKNRKSSEKKEHFMDYALEKGHAPETVRDSKFIYPIIVMFLPLPFFWALFDMQGSRWTLSATQMNGWQGGDSFKIQPDLIQILNPIMILAALPFFAKLVYPAFEACGIKMTPLRKMSAGQLITAFSFVASALVQNAIEDDLTPIPSYKAQNALMVLNAAPRDITVESAYWQEAVIPEGDLAEGAPVPSKFELVGPTDIKWTPQSGGEWRTNTFAWIRDDLPASEKLAVSGHSDVQLNGADGIPVGEQQIKAVVSRVDDMGENELLAYTSSKSKSDSIRVKTVVVNPTKYWIFPRLYKYDYKEGVEKPMNFSGNEEGRYRGVIEPTEDEILGVQDSGLEFDQGMYKIQFDLYVNGSKEDSGKGSVDIDSYVGSCMTNYIWATDANGDTFGAETDNYEDLKKENADYSNVMLKPGSIWTFMVRETQPGSFEIVYGKDSNSNNVNILWLIPQYVILTVGEVMNSATGLEFAYTQAPPSMKSVVQAFWLLTTCIGNLIDVFLVEIELYPTQTGEYFILAFIMVGSALIFILLSMFYYEYVPEAEFDDVANSTTKSEQQSSRTSIKKEEINPAFDEEEL